MKKLINDVETVLAESLDGFAAAHADIVVLGAERQFEPQEGFQRGSHSLERTDQAIAMSAMFLAVQVSPRAIIALTESGATAQWLSRYHRSLKYHYAPMPWSVFFHGGYAVHGTTEVCNLGRPASHGCVRLHPDNGRIFFQLVQTAGKANSKVAIIR